MIDFDYKTLGEFLGFKWGTDYFTIEQLFEKIGKEGEFSPKEIALQQRRAQYHKDPVYSSSWFSDVSRSDFIVKHVKLKKKKTVEKVVSATGMPVTEPTQQSSAMPVNIQPVSFFPNAAAFVRNSQSAPVVSPTPKPTPGMPPPTAKPEFVVLPFSKPASLKSVAEPVSPSLSGTTSAAVGRGATGLPTIGAGRGSRPSSAVPPGVGSSGITSGVPYTRAKVMEDITRFKDPNLASSFSEPADILSSPLPASSKGVGRGSTTTSSGFVPLVQREPPLRRPVVGVRKSLPTEEGLKANPPLQSEQGIKTNLPFLHGVEPVLALAEKNPIANTVLEFLAAMRQNYIYDFSIGLVEILLEHGIVKDEAEADKLIDTCIELMLRRVNDYALRHMPSKESRMEKLFNKLVWILNWPPTKLILFNDIRRCIDKKADEFLHTLDDNSTESNNILDAYINSSEEAKEKIRQFIVLYKFGETKGPTRLEEPLVSTSFSIEEIPEEEEIITEARPAEAPGPAFAEGADLRALQESFENLQVEESRVSTSSSETAPVNLADKSVKDEDKVAREEAENLSNVRIDDVIKIDDELIRKQLFYEEEEDSSRKEPTGDLSKKEDSSKKLLNPFSEERVDEQKFREQYLKEEQLRSEEEDFQQLLKEEDVEFKNRAKKDESEMEKFVRQVFKEADSEFKDRIKEAKSEKEAEEIALRNVELIKSKYDNLSKLPEEKDDGSFISNEPVRLPIWLTKPELFKLKYVGNLKEKPVLTSHTLPKAKSFLDKTYKKIFGSAEDRLWSDIVSKFLIMESPLDIQGKKSRESLSKFTEIIDRVYLSEESSPVEAEESSSVEASNLPQQNQDVSEEGFTFVNWDKPEDLIESGSAALKKSLASSDVPSSKAKYFKVRLDETDSTVFKGPRFGGKKVSFETDLKSLLSDEEIAAISLFFPKSDITRWIEVGPFFDLVGWSLEKRKSLISKLDDNSKRLVRESILYCLNQELNHLDKVFNVYKRVGDQILRANSSVARNTRAEKDYELFFENQKVLMSFVKEFLKEREYFFAIKNRLNVSLNYYRNITDSKFSHAEAVYLMTRLMFISMKLNSRIIQYGMALEPMTMDGGKFQGLIFKPNKRKTILSPKLSLSNIIDILDESPFTERDSDLYILMQKHLLKFIDNYLIFLEEDFRLGYSSFDKFSELFNSFLNFKYKTTFPYSDYYSKRIVILRQVGFTLNKYNELTPFYKSLEDFHVKLIINLKKVFGDDKIIQSTDLLILTFLNLCKVKINNGFERGLSERELRIILDQYFVKFGWKYLGEFVHANFGGKVDLGFIHQTFYQLFRHIFKAEYISFFDSTARSSEIRKFIKYATTKSLSLLQDIDLKNDLMAASSNSNSGYVNESYYPVGGSSNFFDKLWADVFSASDLLRNVHLKRRGDLVFEHAFNTKFLNNFYRVSSLDERIVDLFKQKKEPSMSNVSSLISSDLANRKFPFRDKNLTKILRADPDPDLNPEGFLKSLKHDHEVLLNSFVQELLFISSKLKLQVTKDLLYSEERILKIKLLITLISKVENLFNLSRFVLVDSERFRSLTNLLKEKKVLLNLISFEELKEAGNRSHKLRPSSIKTSVVDFASIDDNLILEILKKFREGPGVKKVLNLKNSKKIKNFHNKFVLLEEKPPAYVPDVSIISKIPRVENKMYSDNLNIFFKDPIQFVTPEISTIVLHDNLMGNLFPTVMSEEVDMPHFKSDLDGVLKTGPLNLRLHEVVSDFTESFLKPLRDFNMSDAGLVHNPLLWFGHLSESYKPFNKEYHAFQVYKERFNFFSSVVTKNIGSSLFGTNYGATGDSNYRQLSSMLQSSSNPLWREDPNFKENVSNQSSYYSKLIGSLPYNFHNTKWILIPDSFNMTLKWFHRDGYRNVVPAPLDRMTAADFWTNRRRFARYFFDEFRLYELLKKDPVILYLLGFEDSCRRFFASYGLSDLVLVELKYYVLDLFFVESVFSRFVDLLVPDMLVEFVSLYRFLCIKLLLAISDRWLWLVISVFKVFFITCFNYVFDDLFGWILLYKGNIDTVHSYISLDPGLLRYEKKFRKRDPSQMLFLLPINYASPDSQSEMLDAFVFRYGAEKWDFYADSIKRHRSNVLHKYYLEARDTRGVRLLQHTKPFKGIGWPELGLTEEDLEELNKSKLLDIGKVFQRPIEYSPNKRRGLGGVLFNLENIVTFQKYTVKPYSVIMQTYDFGSRHSLRRIKQWKYFKPIYLLYEKTDYSFVFQNDLIRKAFFFDDSNGITVGNPYSPSTNYKLQTGFSRPHFGQTNRVDLLVDHYFFSAVNYPGMPKIEFSRDFDVGEFNVFQAKPIVRSYSIFRHNKPDLNFFPNRLINNVDNWKNSFNDDPFRKSMFYFFAWQWTGGYFREFFLSPFHNNFFMFLGSFDQRYNTPIDEYSVPYWQNFLKLLSSGGSGRYPLGSTKSLSYITNSFFTYDRSKIFERFSYDPNFSGQNPYVLNPLNRLSTISSLYDFVDKPGVRQKPLHGRSVAFPHSNIFRRHGGNFESDEPEKDKFHFVKKALYFDSVNQSLPEEMKKVERESPELQWDYFSRKRNLRTVYYTISIVFRFIFKLYLLSFSFFVAYCKLWFYCYKQILFIVLVFSIFRFYVYVFKLILFEYKLRLLLYKNSLIFDKRLYLKSLNFTNNIDKELADIPHFVRVSPLFLKFRKFLIIHFILNLPKYIFVRPFQELWRLFLFNLDRLKTANSNSSSFVLLFHICVNFFKLVLIHRVIHPFYLYYSLFLVIVLRYIGNILDTYIRVLRFFFDSSLPTSRYFKFSVFFSSTFIFYTIGYFFRVIWFLFVRFLLIILRIVRFFIVLSMLFFAVGFYTSSTGHYISELSPQFTHWFLVLFIMWICFSVSKVWGENFVSSGFPEFQPFLEDSGSLEDIYPIVEPELIYPDPEDRVNDVYSEEVFNTMFPYHYTATLSSDPYDFDFYGTTLHEEYPLFPTYDEDYAELIEYEGASIDFSDGDYFNFESEDLSYWYRYHTSFLKNVKALFGPGRYNRGSSSKLESYKNDPKFFVPFFSYAYSVNVQRFYFYVDALHSLNILLKRNVFYTSSLRKQQEFIEVYKTYVFPFYRYYGKVFNPYTKDFDQYRTEHEFFSDLEFMGYYQTVDSFNLFSEYVFDEEDDDVWSLEFDPDKGEELEDDYSEAEEDDDFYMFSEDDEVEEEEDDLEEDGFDFIIPCESYNYSSFFSNYSNTYLTSTLDKVPLSQISSVFEAESFDDNFLIKESGWISELVVDRFLIDISSPYDNSFDSDFFLLSKISQYSDSFLDENMLTAKSNKFRQFILFFLKSLSCTKIGFMTVKLKRNVGMITTRAYSFDKSKDYLKTWDSPDTPKIGPKFNQFDFNSQFFETVSGKRAFLVSYHPYNERVDMKFSKFGLKVVPLLGQEAFDNKYKRKFFKDPIFYINILGLKNYPDLTIEEAQRLWVFLGCTKKEWDSVDKDVSKHQDSVPLFDSLDFPAIIAVFIFCYSLRTWIRYSLLDMRYYIETGGNIFEKIFQTWLFYPSTAQNGFEFVYLKQTFNEYYFSDYNYVLFYRAFKSFLLLFYDWLYLSWTVLSHFISCLIVGEPITIFPDTQWDLVLANIDFGDAQIDPLVLKYFCLFLSYITISYFLKWKNLFDSFILVFEIVFRKLFFIPYDLIYNISPYFYVFLKLDLVFFDPPSLFLYCFDFISSDYLYDYFVGPLFLFYERYVYFYQSLPFMLFIFYLILGIYSFLYSALFTVINLFSYLFLFFLDLSFVFDVFFYLIVFEASDFFFNFSSVCLIFDFLLLFIFYLILFLVYKRLKR